MVASEASQTTAPKRTAIKLPASRFAGEIGRTREDILRPSKPGRSLVSQRPRGEEAGDTAAALGAEADGDRREIAIDSTTVAAMRAGRG
ncbi:hypothetical protein BHE74_00037305 [Ensete ventricosum]|nr:hypothetical protein GW17_00032442 [Ensete ventricosum]RWW56036.1 hypothetical protein BHE74_00037305 [Ensete ventricosum]